MTYRQEQAAATRVRIADAARRLFAVDGYRSTTIEAIAAAAGVGVRTVYAAFGTKREILSLICERWLELAQVRRIVGTALTEPDPLRRVRLAAYFLRALYQEGLDVAQLFDAATVEDAQTRDLLRAKLAGRNQAQDAIIESLRPRLVLPLAAAQAIYRAMAAPGIYRELVVESGWTADEFEDWLARSLCEQLLGVPAPPREDPWPPALTDSYSH
ncbi:MAG TPA: TetR/AcrR family transcriptional regulator [Micromonosporaceae bacterium]